SSSFNVNRKGKDFITSKQGRNHSGKVRRVAREKIAEAQQALKNNEKMSSVRWRIFQTRYHNFDNVDNGDSVRILSIREIAKSTGISTNNVKAQLDFFMRSLGDSWPG